MCDSSTIIYSGSTSGYSWLAVFYPNAQYMQNRVVASVLRGMEEKRQQIVNGLFFLILSAIALFIYIYIYIYVNIKSPDERVITKQACKNESIFSLFFPSKIYIYIYIYMCVCI